MITIVDIGARGGVGKEWKQTDYKAVLFEPDPEANFPVKDNWIVIKSALSDSAGQKKLYVTKKGSKSSFYKPNFRIINQFGSSYRFEVVKEISVHTDTLDNELKKNKINDIDLIKLDVQGHELAILRGAEESLKEAVAVEVEVEFLEMYEGQPLFPEVDAYLRSQDFELVKFIHLEPWVFENRERLAWGEAFYAKKTDLLSLEKRRRLYLINKVVRSRRRVFKKISFKSLVKSIVVRLGLYNIEKRKKVSPLEKVAILLQQKTPEHRIFIETGTNRGDTLEGVKDQFEQIYSIEYDNQLYQEAVERFKTSRHIVLKQGDSAEKLGEVLEKISEPALIWLDAHNDGAITTENSPIIGELKSVFSHYVKNHTVLIDDARHFDWKTTKMIRVLAKENSYDFKVRNGIFRLYGKR